MAYKVDPVTGQLSEYIFEIGGILALRNFTARTIGERLIIESATNANFVILDAFVGEVQIDGVVYDDPIAAQEALQRLVFNPNVPVIMTLQQQQMLLGALQKGSYSGTASELKQHLETLINNKVTQEPGKGLISDSEKTDIAENKKKRVIDFTITGDVDKIFTLIYNDGSTKAKNFTDIVGQSGADVMLNSLNFNKDTGVLTGVRSDGQQLTVDLNGRFALLNHSHAWNDITGKPATFPPSPHTHVVNWNDVQNKPDLSQLGAKSVIKVTVDTASHLKDKIGTTTAGNYVPQEGDELVVDFTNGTWVNNVTLNIDGSGVKNVKLVGKNVDRNHLSVSPNVENKIVRMWYDGSYYQMYGATVNTTYGSMTIEHARDNTTTSAFLVSAVLLAWVRNWANIIDKPLKLVGDDLNVVNPENENEYKSVKASGYKTSNGNKGKVLASDGSQLFFTKGVNVSAATYQPHNDYIDSGIIFLTGGGDKTINLHELENHTVLSFKKCYDGGMIYLKCTGKTIVMRGADAFNGADGSNAVISIVNNKCYVDINNYD